MFLQNSVLVFLEYSVAVVVVHSQRDMGQGSCCVLMKHLSTKNAYFAFWLKWQHTRNGKKCLTVCFFAELWTLFWSIWSWLSCLKTEARLGECLLCKIRREIKLSSCQTQEGHTLGCWPLVNEPGVTDILSGSIISLWLVHCVALLFVRSAVSQQWKEWLENLVSNVDWNLLILHMEIRPLYSSPNINNSIGNSRDACTESGISDQSVAFI